MKVFIVGVKGRVAKRHIKAWKELDVEVYGCGSDVDYKSLIQNNTYDIIDICTPIHLHYEMIKFAAKFAQYVICEKPLALTRAQAEELTSYENVCIIYQFRYNPKILKLRKELLDGKYGEIKLVTAQYYRYRSDEYYKTWEKDSMRAGGGTVFNVCIHYLDLLQWMFGYPTEIYGMTTSAKQYIDVEDTAVGMMRFPSGMIGSITFSTHVNPPKHFELSIYGTRGHTTIQLRENEYHKQNFEAYLRHEDYVTAREAFKSWKIAHQICG